ncbi:hypothetical protein HFP15_31970 [Amycolatopsis sp. K13G38]|uniref:Type II toxin-antitoxin system RelE/ParE family toxin n=1 Tax=Amycolatopsis acididurans TaxID=2724524 RepID=A0ABX1JE32_9PSEU|nr:hypothetical protein [Amycolatopsis acididurans]NKQ57491.1 hypothetical protein [Amycolatopsis acididurans]
MSPKRGDPVAPPPTANEWAIRYATTAAIAGWKELEATASGNLRRAWEAMRNNPAPGSPTGRHHQLKGSLATGTHRGRVLPRWQIEVTGGARIWYLVDEDHRTVWVQHAAVGHPKQTE